MGWVKFGNFNSSQHSNSIAYLGWAAFASRLANIADFSYKSTAHGEMSGLMHEMKQFLNEINKAFNVGVEDFKA